MIKNLPTARHSSEFVSFAGGLDVVSPPITIPPGHVRRSQNFEQDVNKGYVTLTGYERFDGRASPSDANYATLLYSVLGTVAVGNTITGATSGATGVVIAITATEFVLTKTTGTFVAENTTTGGATISGPATINSKSGSTHAIYKALAADTYRSDILTVPGTGNILGVWYYKGVVYAFRNKVTSGVGMYKSSGLGWTAVALGISVKFSAASGTAPAEGATITKGATSAVLARLVIESGTFAAGTAAGQLIFATVTAGPFTAGPFTGGITATCVSQTTIDITNQNGRFEFINANFTGLTSTLRMYGCDGANRAFEFDGTTFVPINTGNTLDTPLHIAEHQSHLFLSFNSSAQHSAIGEPYNWAAISGAVEIALSDNVTGFVTQPGSDASPAMAIYCRNKTYILYGTDAITWNLVKYSDEFGAIPYSIQRLGQTFVMDDRGITALFATQKFGNFEEVTISQRVKSWIAEKRNQVKDSHISRDKSQYRLFFNDGTAAYWTLSSKSAAMMPIFLPNKCLVSCSTEEYSGGKELIYFGSDNGYVYQMEKGTSFDGANIECYMEMVFNNLKSYRVLKKFRHITFEMVGNGYAEFSTTYDLAYASALISQPDQTSSIVDMATVYWDSFVWDTFVWDGSPMTMLSMSTPGNGENIAIRINTNNNFSSQLKFSGAFIEYSPLRMLR